MKQIGSYEEFVELIKKKERVFVLIYKDSGELGECAEKNLCEARSRVDAAEVYGVNVLEVRDIHGRYHIKTAPSLLDFKNGELKNVIKGCMSTQYYEQLLNDSFAVVSAKGVKPQKSVTVYSTPTCSWCGTLKNHLKVHNIRFREIDVSKDAAKAEEMKRRSGQSGVPQTDIGGQMVVGFDKARINSLLGIQ